MPPMRLTIVTPRHSAAFAGAVVLPAAFTLVTFTVPVIVVQAGEPVPSAAFVPPRKTISGTPSPAWYGFLNLLNGSFAFCARLPQQPARFVDASQLQVPGEIVKPPARAICVQLTQRSTDSAFVRATSRRVLSIYVW